MVNGTLFNFYFHHMRHVFLAHHGSKRFPLMIVLELECALNHWDLK